MSFVAVHLLSLFWKLQVQGEIEDWTIIEFGLVLANNLLLIR